VKNLCIFQPLCSRTLTVPENSINVPPVVDVRDVLRPAHELRRDQLQPDSHADYIFEQGQVKRKLNEAPCLRGFSSVLDPSRTSGYPDRQGFVRSPYTRDLTYCKEHRAQDRERPPKGHRWG
jgi:hypothetical protein